MTPRDSRASVPSSVAELHLHLEGSLSPRMAVELASTLDHPWKHSSERDLARRFRVRTFSDFLEVIKQMCGVLSSPEALETAAKSLACFLARHGVRYAEVYFSPHVFVRWGIEFGDAARAVVSGFDRGEEEGGADCHIIYDTVRQWGVDPACSILRAHEKIPMERVVGFGIGGDESEPLGPFKDVFARARDLGLRTTAHAGELGPATDVAIAINELSVDRVAHGLRSLDDPGLVREIASRRIPLDLAVTSNYRTGAVRGAHPICRLLDAGVVVTLSTDDPGIFRTDPDRELRRAVRCGGVGSKELEQIQRNAVDCSFADERTKVRLVEILEKRFHPRKEPS